MRYEVLGSLARGGMAELFLAQLPGAEGFTKQVALKRVLPELARDRAFVEMFLAEARLAATLDHQNIVQVHDIGQDEHGFFFAMELLHGADVGTILSAVTRFGGELPLPVALEIARNACAGLHYAHERRTPAGEPLGLVHRDISPQNLFVTFDGAVKVLDFGIAKAAQALPTSQTRTGALRGKIPYMSPEQCSGQLLDCRSDVFSLSIVLWEMTVGERLYGGNGEADLAILKAIVEQDAPRPSARKPGYPPELERIVMRGLARERHDRFQTADELQAALEALARQKSWWHTAREMATFMADLFPDRARVWKDNERRGTRPMLSSPRLTTPLPPAVAPPPPMATPAVPVTPGIVAAAPALTPGVVAPLAPGVVAGAPPNVAPPRSRLGFVVGGIVAVGALALAGGYVLGRSTKEQPAPKPVVPRAPTAEDAHWFQADDYLVSERGGYPGERLNDLWVAKRLGTGSASPGIAVEFLDANGRDVSTAHFWKTRVATPEELVVGATAFCQTFAYGVTASKPHDRAESRTHPWIMGRVTDTGHIPEGKVSVANAVCDVPGVRVPDGVSGDAPAP